MFFTIPRRLTNLSLLISIYTQNSFLIYLPKCTNFSQNAMKRFFYCCYVILIITYLLKLAYLQNFIRPAEDDQQNVL